MTSAGQSTKSPRLRVHSGPRLADLPQLSSAPAEIRRDIRVVSQVLPFKVNDYVLDELIDWSNAPDDPIYRLTFPHRDMLAPEAYARMAALIDTDAPAPEIRETADKIRRTLNPHPGGQLTNNIPDMGGDTLDGLQHKYRETVLFFPSQGQTCHSYCGYCFRWAQFVGMDELRQASKDAEVLQDYLAAHTEVSDVLFTGGDPMIMATKRLAEYIEPLLAPRFEHIRTIRIGTKALSYWPYRFTTDRDADDLMRLIERCVQHGKHVAIMAHFTHPRELMTNVAHRAVSRLQAAGAVIRTQSPIVRHVNDSADVWAEMWNEQVRVGCVPYYMFVERDTGALPYYGMPLQHALVVYSEARRRVSGLGRTARGPVMSSHPGKLVVDAITELQGERVFVLRFLQARNPEHVGRHVYARFDPEAAWLHDLVPAFGEERFFFE